MKFSKRFLNDILYCGLSKEAYEEIKPLIVQRNRYMLKFTSIMMTSLGALLLMIQFVIGGGYSHACFPYLFMTVGGGLAIFARKVLRWNKEKYTMLFCYIQIILVLTYAIILGASPQNRDDPSASFVVFLVAMPLTLNDRPIRMAAVVILSSAVYLVISSYVKTPHAFSTDIFNVVSFSVIGMILYVIVSNRNVQEIFRSERERKLQENIVFNMATVIEERDESTGDHIQGTVDYVRKTVERMKGMAAFAAYSEEYYQNVWRAAPLHDVGKIKIPDNILKKPGRLTPEEFEIMKKHASYGGEIIKKTLKNLGDKDYYEVAYNIAKYHHERYDGTGYPAGLKGEEIPLEARIMALADVYEALISERVYKKAFPKEKAIEIIRDGRGTQFDPILTDLFLSVLD